EKKYQTSANFLLHGGDYNPDQWLDYPEVLAQDIELMKEANANAFSIGMFAWASLEPEEGVYNFEWLDDIINNIASIGGKVLLSTPSGARPAWMSQKYPEVLRVNASRQKLRHGARHNHCFSSPVYREKTQKINRLLAERYGDNPAIVMWHVSNEYGGECHCDYCQQAFRSWLKDRYNNNLDELNHAWWGPFWSHTITDWTQIESPSPIGEDAVHGMNLDWRRFVSDQTIDFYKNEIAPLRELTPGIPITTNFMADGNDLIPFQGLDYSKFAKEVDVMSWDAYPAWHNDWDTTADLAMKVAFVDDLYRSLKDQPFLLLESTPSGVNWHNVNKAKRPGMHYLSAMQMLAHGSDSIMYFQWRKSRGSSEKFHGAVVDHDGSTDNRVFQDVKEVGQALKDMPAIAGSMRQSEVAVVYDWENHWALGDTQGYGLQTKRYPQTVQEHYRAFWENDIPVDVITKEQDFSKYKLLVVPMLYLMSKETIRRLKSFVEQGGRLVTTYISGVVNEFDLTYLGGWPKELQEIFGINPLETDTYYPSDKNQVKFQNGSYEVTDYATILSVNSAEILGAYQSDFYEGSPAITKNEYQKGEAYYIGARLDADFHREFYGKLIDELQLKPVLAVAHERGVSVQGRQVADETYYVFIMNFTEEEQEVSFEAEVKDVRTQEKLFGKVLLAPYEARVVEHKI
ncbi:MAG TPA: beta-galactosidase, partial [Candidatus Jeotgalibaca pullicola]|nr:beta-galactosidase [Candidatus Jeotgalibaca pullicola]